MTATALLQSFGEYGVAITMLAVMVLAIAFLGRWIIRSWQALSNRLRQVEDARVSDLKEVIMQNKEAVCDLTSVLRTGLEMQKETLVLIREQTSMIKDLRDTLRVGSEFHNSIGNAAS